MLPFVHSVIVNRMYLMSQYFAEKSRIDEDIEA